MAILNGLTDGTWTIDTSHSAVGFQVRHLMVAKVRGSFASFSGAIVVTGDSATVNVDIDPASINTRDENRDNHVRSGDFFDVENHQKW